MGRQRHGPGGPRATGHSLEVVEAAWIGFAGALLGALAGGIVQWAIHVSARDKKKRDDAHDTLVAVAEWTVEVRKALDAKSSVLPARRSDLDAKVMVNGSDPLKAAVSRFDEVFVAEPKLELDLWVSTIEIPLSPQELAALNTVSPEVWKKRVYSEFERPRKTSLGAEESASGSRPTADQMWSILEPVFDRYRVRRTTWMNDLSASLDDLQIHLTT